MLRAGQGIALCSMCLLVLGVVFVNSASLDVSGDSKTTFDAILGGRATLFAIASAAAILALYRFNYTRYTRDVRYWNKRKFTDSPGALKAESSCAAATAALSAGVADMTSSLPVQANYTTGSMPPPPGVTGP